MYALKTIERKLWQRERCIGRCGLKRFILNFGFHFFIFTGNLLNTFIRHLQVYFDICHSKLVIEVWNYLALNPLCWWSKTYVRMKCESAATRSLSTHFQKQCVEEGMFPFIPREFSDWVGIKLTASRVRVQVSTERRVNTPASAI